MTCARSQNKGEVMQAWAPPYPLKVTESFISRDMLARAADLQNISMTVVDNEQPPFVSEINGGEETVKIVFAAMHANNSEFSESKEELHPPWWWGNFNRNKRRYLAVSKRLNEPFVDSVPSTVFRLADFIDNVSNDSFYYNDTEFKSAILFFPGGHMSVHNLAFSRDHSLFQGCRTIKWYKNQTLQTSVPHFELFRQFPPYESVLVAMDRKNAPSFCGGSGMVFADHSEMGQRIWGNAGPPTTVGTVTNDDLNDGNTVVKLRAQDRFNLEKIYDSDFGIQPSRITDIIKDADAEYHRGVEQYDNVAFLILSIAAILSSTAVASVSPGRELDRILIVLVEASVVYSFLAIVTRAMMVLLRREAYSLDITMINDMNLTFGNAENIIIAHLNFSMAIVGMRTTFPTKLVVTELVSVVAAVIVTWTIVVAFASIKFLKKPKDVESGDADSAEVEGMEKVVVGMDDLSESGGDLEKISVARKIRNKISSVRR